jgi:hypothetical protein
MHWITQDVHAFPDSIFNMHAPSTVQMRLNWSNVFGSGSAANTPYLGFPSMERVLAQTYAAFWFSLYPEGSALRGTQRREQGPPFKTIGSYPITECQESRRAVSPPRFSRVSMILPQVHLRNGEALLWQVLEKGFPRSPTVS